ncbi:hypothetical protein [Paenibacillus sp. CCS19]|uniref:hypothetical protein n=1 Tax=Paenibacillus sp. CCS19 TaxID=3158387 RepID=UPI00295E6BB8|nr:hypothetical protein [Paenibacillus cellulosilyticus]
MHCTDQSAGASDKRWGIINIAEVTLAAVRCYRDVEHAWHGCRRQGTADDIGTERMEL